jgi:hypothetical protein
MPIAATLRCRPPCVATGPAERLDDPVEVGLGRCRLQVVVLVVASRAAAISGSVRVTGTIFDPHLPDNEATAGTAVK